MALAWKGSKAVPMLRTLALEHSLVSLRSDGLVVGRDEKHFVRQTSICKPAPAKIALNVWLRHPRNHSERTA